MKMMKVLFVGSLLASLVADIGIASAQAEPVQCPRGMDVCDCWKGGVNKDLSSQTTDRTRGQKNRGVGRLVRKNAGKSARRRNAERRRQRRLQRVYDEFLAEMYIVAVELGEFELAMEIIDELGNGGSGETGGILTLTLNGKVYQEIGPPDYVGPDKTVKMKALIVVPPTN